MTFPVRRLLPVLLLTLAVLSAARANDNTPSALVDKPAPDIEAEYAVNGKVTRLSDFWEKKAKGKEKKEGGKVVLLIFGHLSKGATWNGLAEAQTWYARNKLYGLPVIMIPAYDPEKQPQRWSRFEAVEGKAFKSKSTTREQEEQVLKEFAADRGLKYPIWKVAPEEAKKVFSGYDVKRTTNVPEFVVIDPKGKVRLVHIGFEKAEVVQEMLDKLIQENR